MPKQINQKSETVQRPENTVNLLNSNREELEND